MFDYDVNKHYPKVSDELVKKYEAIEESASINESMTESGALDHEFRPVWPGLRTVGTAFTVKARPGDNLIIHRALQLIQPGDVLVISCDGFQESGGMFGGIMSNVLMQKGGKGLIIDGSIRDTVMMKKIGLPCWSRGISIRMSTKLTGGKINVPINIGGVRVYPGDLIFADNDAVVCVPREQAQEVYDRTVAREIKEDGVLESVIKDGKDTWNDKYAFYYGNLGLTEEPD